MRFKWYRGDPWFFAFHRPSISGMYRWTLDIGPLRVFKEYK